MPNVTDKVAHGLALAAVFVTTGLALWSRRYIVTGAWTFLPFGAVVLPWYAVWGFPYAILQRTFLPIFLITLPALAFDLSTSFGITPAARLLFLVVVCSPIAVVLSERLPGRR